MGSAGASTLSQPQGRQAVLSAVRAEAAHSACCHPHHRLSLLSSPPIAVKKLAKKGLTPSQIGVILRDSHGIAQVKSVTGNKILRLLKKEGAYARLAGGGSGGRVGRGAAGEVAGSMRVAGGKQEASMSVL